VVHRKQRDDRRIPIAEFTGLTNLLAVMDDDISAARVANTFISLWLSQALPDDPRHRARLPPAEAVPRAAASPRPPDDPVHHSDPIGAMAWTWMLNPTYSVINWMGVHAGLSPRAELAG